MSANFQSLGLSPALIDVLSDGGITDPFPIQAAAIPDALAGRDIQGRAPTGSGKTLAFGLPMLSLVGRGTKKRPRALILAPTRELAEQIRRDLTPLGKAVDRRVAAVYGGVGYGPQRRDLNSGVDVLVATPGRLEDLIEQGSADLSQVEILVLDEADRMADMGFLPAVRRILSQTKRPRQTILFSATLDGDVAGLSRSEQRDPVSVISEPTEEMEIDHHFWRVDRAERVAQTAQIIGKSARTIVFTRTRHGADRLVKQLGREGISAEAMHGGRSQSQRTRALHAFSVGKSSALVATDVAARGIHVEDVDVVLHYDIAGDPKDYTHRSGRTARAGARGTVITLVDHGQDREVRKIQRATGLNVPIETPASDVWSRSDKPSQTRPPHRERPQRNKEDSHRPGSAGTSNIFVGNLPWRTEGADLEAMFRAHGTVERATISKQKRSGRSKGYGFVDMPAAQAHAAIAALNGSVLDGRKLQVRMAR